MNNIVFENVQYFNPRHTFLCGQCFRWEEQSDGSFTGIAGDKVANVKMNDTIEAVDVCIIIFELLTLVAFALVKMVEDITTVALWTLVLAGAVSVIYKVYYGFRYANWGGRIKGIFRRK